MQISGLLMRRTLLLVIVMVAVDAVRANEANVRSFIVGDRAAGMGGAASAIASGLDACFYNPAGLVRTKHNSISFSASLYGYDRYAEDDALYPGENLKSDSFITIPACMGSVFTLGTNASLAFSVFVPNKALMSEIVAFMDTQHFFNFYVDDETLWLGPSFGYALAPEFYVGVSVFGVYRTYSHFESIYLKDHALSHSMNLKYDNVGMISLLGAQYKPDDRWNFGLTVHTPSLNLWGDGKMEQHYLYGDQHGAVYMENMRSHNQLPARFTTGVAWQNLGRYAVAADLSYHLPTSFTRLDGLDEHDSLKIKRESVVDVSLGGEYYVRDLYPVRCGFFTSFSSAPDQDIDNLEYPVQIDLYGLTASAGVEGERLTMNLGINYAFGSGKGLGWASEEGGDLVSRVVDARSQHLFVFVNTAYLF